MSLYLWINLLTFLFPFLLSFDKKVAFFKSWRSVIPATLMVGVIFIVWDIYFTKNEIWWFNEEYLTGIYIFGLPIEECLFFFTIPYACVFIFEVIKAYFPKMGLHQFCYWFSFLFTIFTIIMAFSYRANWYSFSAFLTAGLLNWVVYFGWTPKWYNHFIVSFLITLIPFIIVNGILTGSITEAPVVGYNESHIVGIRIGTIPLEDVFYNFSLLFPIVIIHQFIDGLFQKKKAKSLKA